MEGVNHINVVQICGGSLVSQVNGVFERDIPDRKRLKFGIAGFHAAFILVIKLRQAGSHLTAPGTGGGHDNKGL